MGWAALRSTAQRFSSRACAKRRPAARDSLENPGQSCLENAELMSSRGPPKRGRDPRRFSSPSVAKRSGRHDPFTRQRRGSWKSFLTFGGVTVFVTIVGFLWKPGETGDLANFKKSKDLSFYRCQAISRNRIMSPLL